MYGTRILSFCAIALCGEATVALADAAEGADIFATYCVACHGEEGRGDGRMAPILSILPADLTQLSAENDGVFPTSRITRKIDGRDPLLAHGGVMPLYGMFFEGNDQAIASETGQPILTSKPIVDVTEFLMSIQE